MTDDECEHGSMPSSCPVCLGPLPKLSSYVVPVGGPFAAKYDGQCPGCNLGIHVGQTITAMSTGQYVHLHCVRS